jgi:hypothetical protein
MTIEQLQKEILNAIKINKDCISVSKNINQRDVKLLRSDYKDLSNFVIKLFKEYKEGVIWIGKKN